ncbi:MAG: DEAD/DEAH box helicase [Clostridia bacterium]
MTNIKLNVQYVTDVIGEEYKKWRSGDVVKIKTQTGSGKTYFIKNTLIPYIDEINNLKIFNDFKVLILTNRIALSRQTKNDLLKKYNMQIPSNLKDLDKIKQIKNITLMNYQSLNEYIMNESNFNVNYYDYIICDEIQYIFEDSFTGNTELALNELIYKSNKESIKIFMSATMEQLDNMINKSNCRIWEYDTNRDYSYLIPHTYSKQEQLIKQIDDDKSKDKWLIFVASIQKGKDLLKELQEKNIDAVMIYKGRRDKKSRDEFNNIITKEKFSCKVLITTKLLDNGVNIMDDKVKNIVVNSWSRENLIQSIGRVRFKNLKEAYNINLYLDEKTHKQVWSKLNATNKTLKHFELLIADKNECNKKFRNKLNQLPNGIHLDKNNQFIFDKVTYANLLKTKIEMTNLEKDFNSISYINKQLSWLGINDKEIIRLEEIQAKQTNDEIEEYIKSLIDKPLGKQQREELIQMINLRDARGRQQKTLKTINAYLQENYNIYMESKVIRFDGNRVRVWILKNK